MEKVFEVNVTSQNNEKLALMSIKYLSCVCGGGGEPEPENWHLTWAFHFKLFHNQAHQAKGLFNASLEYFKHEPRFIQKEPIETYHAHDVERGLNCVKSRNVAIVGWPFLFSFPHFWLRQEMRWIVLTQTFWNYFQGSKLGGPEVRQLRPRHLRHARTNRGLHLVRAAVVAQR